jgi:hypothetical protein
MNFSETSKTIATEQHKQQTDLLLDLSTYPGRIAARAYAYALIATGDRKSGEDILERVGREG